MAVTRSSSAGKRVTAGGSGRNLITFAVVSFYVTAPLFWMVMSVSTTLMNKMAFPRETFPHPFTITFFQMAVAVFWLALLTLLQRIAPGSSLLRLLNVSEAQPLQWRPADFLTAAGPAGAFTMMLATGNLCLMFVQVSFYQAAKSQHILCILLISYFFLGESHPLKVVLACGGVTLGFAINALAEATIYTSLLDEDLRSLGVGCLAGLVSSCFVALYPLLLNRALGKGASKWQLSINVNTMSLAWYLPLLAYEAHAGSMLAAPALRSPRFWAFNFATASVGFALNIAAMLQVRYTSPLTHMIVGSFKGAVTSVIGVVFFGNHMNPQSALGLSILIASSFAYSYLKQAPAPSARKGRAA